MSRVESFIPAINTSIFSKIFYENIFSKKLINELHDCIENKHHVIHTPYVKDSVFFKMNGTLVNKKTI